VKHGAKRLHTILLACIGLCVLVLLLSVYLVNMLLTGQSKKVANARLAALVQEEKQSNLSKARADIQKYKDLSEIAGAIVPQDKDQAQAVREIVKIAENTGVKLGTVTFPTSSLGGTKPGVGGGNAALSQLKAAKGISGVYALDIAVGSDNSAPSTYDNFIKFLDALEHNRRTALVTSITIQPNTTDPDKLTFTLNLTEFIKP
jgi:hypothetical protein